MTTTTDISIHSHNFKSFLSADEAAAKDKKVRDQDLWTTEYLADQLFLHLASVKETITNDKGDTLTVRKYYHQARNLMKWIPITKPSREFIIYTSDLVPKLKQELVNIASNQINFDTLNYVVTQSIARIFENLDFEYYHLSVARCLRWRFV
jgi:hypothetical protein